MDFELEKQKIRDMVDDELCGQIKAGIIQGVTPTPNCTRAQARQLVPALSSDNPSRIWTRSQQTAMSTSGTMLEALDYFKNILLPAAYNALIDQRGSVLPSGNTCDWPPSFMASEWVDWCEKHIRHIIKMVNEKVYNLNNNDFWYIGEVSTRMIEGAIAVDTTYKDGKEVLHFYPEKNWY